MSLISHAAASRTWLLRTPGSAYAVRVDGDDIPRQLYWGRPLSLDQAESLAAAGRPLRVKRVHGRTPVGEELPVDGRSTLRRALAAVRFADGTRSLEWAAEGTR